MNILIDQEIQWEHVSTLTMKSGEVRSYYLAQLPYLALLVMHNGLGLGNVQGRIVDAAVGKDRADPGFARRPGTEQLKVSIFRIVSGRPADSLSAIVRRRAPKV